MPQVRMSLVDGHKEPEQGHLAKMKVRGAWVEKLRACAERMRERERWGRKRARERERERGGGVY